MEIKLRDVPELNYSVNNINSETGIPEPTGEILMRGPIVFKGFLNDEKNTKESFDKDGWLLTGDVGVILTGNGNAIRLIDRVKSIFKLSQGEYIAPEKIENILSKSIYVHQIYVTGLSQKSFVLGFIVPNKKSIAELLQKKGIPFDVKRITEMYNEKEILTKIISDLDHVGRMNGLKGFELVKKIKLIEEPFSIENNLITLTLKLKRTELKKKFYNDIIYLYSS